MMRLMLRRALVLCAAMLLGAGHTMAQAPAGDAAVPPAGDAAEFPQPDASAERYILGPGDVIQVFVWQSPELSTTVPVLPDGRVSTPLVDGIVASGKTPVQLARDIEAALDEYVRSPRVSVLVSTPKSTMSQVRLVGQVGQPQAIAFQDGLTVLDAVLAAGGLTQFAAGNRAKILRKVDGKDKEIRVRISDLMQKGDLKQNLPLQPGDILVVPETFF